MKYIPCTIDEEKEILSSLGISTFKQLISNIPENLYFNGKYDLNKPFSQKEKDKIFKPFEFRGNFHYSMITELKWTYTEDIHQEIHFYGSPSVGYGYEDAIFQSVSQSTYSFEICVAFFIFLLLIVIYKFRLC